MTDRIDWIAFVLMIVVVYFAGFWYKGMMFFTVWFAH